MAKFIFPIPGVAEGVLYENKLQLLQIFRVGCSQEFESWNVWLLRGSSELELSSEAMPSTPVDSSRSNSVPRSTTIRLFTESLFFLSYLFKREAGEASISISVVLGSS